MTLPNGAQRLFFDDLVVDARSDFALERLLEEGDSVDLRWLVTERGEAALTEWLRCRGGRRLTRRSRAFWGLVLGWRPSPESRLAPELWPL